MRVAFWRCSAICLEEQAENRQTSWGDRFVDHRCLRRAEVRWAVRRIREGLASHEDTIPPSSSRGHVTTAVIASPRLSGRGNPGKTRRQEADLWIASSLPLLAMTAEPPPVVATVLTMTVGTDWEGPHAFSGKPPEECRPPAWSYTSRGESESSRSGSMGDLVYS